jgi:hypothetical protein
VREGVMMSIKDEIVKETDQLVHVKKPFETAAALLFGIFFVQQLFYILLNFIEYFRQIGVRNDFVDGGGATYKVYFSFNMNGSTPNIPVFVGRILGVDASKFFWVLVSLLFLALWYFLIWLLVWNYCRKHNYAKWTWTALIAFGPGTIFLVPTYLLYAIYVFRPYVFRFIRRGVDEFRNYDKDHVFEEEVTEDHSEFKK